MTPFTSSAWLSQNFPNISLDTCGQLALANLKLVARRTALTGSAGYLDALVLCPGFQTQQDAVDLNRGEFPACANMTSDYVFRVENQATVLFCQRVGRTGSLTTVTVRPATAGNGGERSWRRSLGVWLIDAHNFPSVATYAALVAVAATLGTFSTVCALEDWWAVAAIATLIFARLLNVIVVRRRANTKWFGAEEEGYGDLLILLSQDRWVRIKGATNDLKRVTSGEWLRDTTFVESAMVGLATLLAYSNIVLVSNATQLGQILIIALLVCSACLLGLANENTKLLQLHGRILEVTKGPIKYHRRRDLADELIKETKRDGWAVRLGMIHPKKSSNESDVGPPIM